MRRPLLLCLLLAAAIGPVELFGSGAREGARAIVDSGHLGATRWMEFDEKRGLLFSSGDDGTVRIWDPVAGDLVRVLQVTRLATGRIAVDPSAPHLAVVVTDGAGSNFLEVWDWEQQRQLFRVILREDPLFLRFSALGTYVLYGESSWQGLKIISSKDGAAVGFHPEGFGIVGFAEMSRSEKTLMTYLVSGRITYWDVESGDQTLDVPTVPYLTGLRISSDRNFLVGYTPSAVVRVDAQSGVERGRVSLPGVVALDISPGGDTLTCVSGPGRLVTRWTLSDDSIDALPQPPPLPQPPSLVTYGADETYFAGSSGGFVGISPSGAISQFGNDSVAEIFGFDVGRGSVALGSRDWVRVFSSDSLDGSAPLTAIRTALARNPFVGPVGLSFVGEGRLLGWGSDSAGVPSLAVLPTGAMGIQAEASLSFTVIPSPFTSVLTVLRAASDEMIGIESGGGVRIADPTSGSLLFDARIPGAAAVLRVSPREIIAGRNTTSAREGSLLRVNTGTGETVAIRGRNIYTFRLLLDPGASGNGPFLYTVGIDSAGSTNLLRYDGPGFERETLLDTVGEEDLDATLALDPGDHVLYATLGKDRTVAWDGQSLRTLTLENTVPRRLAVRGGLLFSLNGDSTITVADPLTGAFRGQIALFNDGEWAMVFKNGSYAASTGGDLHVRVFVDDRPVKATEDYRVHIETR